MASGGIGDIRIDVSDGEIPRFLSAVAGFSLFTHALRCRGGVGGGWGWGGGPVGFRLPPRWFARRN